MGAWFEALLFEWLLKQGSADFEPLLAGCELDAAYSVGGRTMAVEARFVGESPRSRRTFRILSHLFRLLEGIEEAFLIELQHVEVELDSAFEDQSFRDAVEVHLRAILAGARAVDSSFMYKASGVRITMRARFRDRRKQVAVLAGGEVSFVNPAVFDDPIKKKASQHRPARREYPYVVALFIEDATLSSEEVVTSWEKRVGRLRNTQRPHGSLSGILAMRLAREYERRSVEGVYIENVGAKRPVAPSSFPRAGCVAGSGA